MTETETKINPTAYHWPCSIQEYHADGKVSVSHSELDTFIDSPKLYAGRYLTGVYPRSASDALDFGQVFHDIVFGPDYKIDRDNFNQGTVAIWYPTVAPPIEPDFISESGSAYWFGKDVVIRKSDHWGTVGSCHWGLSAGNVGWCDWRNFFHNDIFRIVPPEVLNADGHRKGAAWKQWEAENDRFILMKEAEFAPIGLLMDSMLDCQPACDLLGGEGQNEYSIKWTDEETGIVCRCRLDRWKAGANIAADLKSCKSAKPEDFAFAALSWGYHRQAAFYSDGVEALTGVRPDFAFIAVEKTAPFACEVIELDPEFVYLGHLENHVALRNLAKARDSGVWQSPTHGQIIRVKAPNKARYSNQYDFTP